jgi:hypothetical protein
MTCCTHPTTPRPRGPMCVCACLHVSVRPRVCADALLSACVSSAMGLRTPVGAFVLCGLRVRLWVVRVVYSNCVGLPAQVDLEYNRVFIALARRAGARAYVLLGAMSMKALSFSPRVQVGAHARG